jgi:hypothetical protein
MVQCLADIPWYDWVLNNVLNKGLQMFEMWVCVLPHSCCLLRACVPACTCVSSVPVPDADALDRPHARA